MTFDIRKLDKADEYSAEGEEALSEYRDALIGLFAESPEGQNHRRAYPGVTWWAEQFIHYGHAYVGVTIPRMSVADVDEIVMEIFPRKISILSPDEAKDAIPELIAFWQYLKREYKLRQAHAILKYLNDIKPDDFVDIMNDPSRFGMAKSFVMAGHSAGFDMTDKEELNAFMNLYNAALLAESEGLLEEPSKPTSRRKQEKAKQKRKRKTARAARKRSTRKRRK